MAVVRDEIRLGRTSSNRREYGDYTVQVLKKDRLVYVDAGNVGERRSETGESRGTTLAWAGVLRHGDSDSRELAVGGARRLVRDADGMEFGSHPDCLYWNALYTTIRRSVGMCELESLTAFQELCT